MEIRSPLNSDRHGKKYGLDKPSNVVVQEIDLDEPKHDITTFYFMCKRPYTVDPLMRLRSGNYIFNELVPTARYEMVDTMKYAPYSTGAKYCSECRIFLFTTSNFCPCSSTRLRTHARKRKND